MTNDNSDPEQKIIEESIEAKRFNCNPVKDVFDFQEQVLGNEFPTRPLFMREQQFQDQIEKLEEELEELQDATNIADQADALIDLIYLSFGMLHQMGVPAEVCWAEVQRANMTKKRGMTKRGHENDAAKPEDWTPPDHSWLDRLADEEAA